MDIQIVDNADVAEPIELAEVKAYLQIDAEYSTDDDTLTTCLTAARKRLEAYLNIGLVKREVAVYWSGNMIELPLSPTGDIISVKNGDYVIPIDDYNIVNYPAKRIGLNSCDHLHGNWFYSMNNSYAEFTPDYSQSNNDVYVCLYETGYETLPGDLKQAILAECSYLYNLRGAPITDLISPNASLLASSYSRNLIL